MKSKTIKSAIRAKINKWLESITDPEIRQLAEENTIVTGGSVVSMFLGEKINDYDVYFRTIEATRRIAEYYVAKFNSNPPVKFKDSPDKVVQLWVESDETSVKCVVKSAGIASEEGSEGYEYFETRPDETGENFVDAQMRVLSAADEIEGAQVDKGEKYRPIFVSTNAITLSHGVQIVTRFIGDPEQIHQFFDFVHCTCYWKSWDGELVLPAAALEAILTKELRYVGSLYPLCSIIRIRKFVARGWTINAGQILKMCMQLNDLDLRDIKVLQDQLTGVDAAYFLQIISQLKKKQHEDGTEGQSIDSGYLMTLIDRLF